MHRHIQCLHLSLVGFHIPILQTSSWGPETRQVIGSASHRWKVDRAGHGTGETPGCSVIYSAWPVRLNSHAPGWNLLPDPTAVHLSICPVFHLLCSLTCSFSAGLGTSHPLTDRTALSSQGGFCLFQAPSPCIRGQGTKVMGQRKGQAVSFLSFLCPCVLTTPAGISHNSASAGDIDLCHHDVHWSHSFGARRPLLPPGL